ncbi:MAG: hypothetical protein ABII12_07470 [Planctomycetota bacterium]
MKSTHAVAALLVCAAVVAALPRTAAAQNCPTVYDQVVVVSTGQPATFTLQGSFLEESEITVFQYPLGGIIEQTGERSTDFVFVPYEDFSGMTTFTYRVTPPSHCSENVLLGTVTLVGGTAERQPPPIDPGLCGLGLLPPLALTGCLIAAVPFRRRTRL